MSDGPAIPDPPTPTERRLGELLGALRAEPPVPSADLPSRVLRAARWQRTLRSGLQVGGWIVEAASGALSLLAGRRR